MANIFGKKNDNENILHRLNKIEDDYDKLFLAT